MVNFIQCHTNENPAIISLKMYRYINKSGTKPQTVYPGSSIHFFRLRDDFINVKGARTYFSFSLNI